MNKINKIKSRRIFTLIEVVLALGIFSLVALTVVLALGTVINTREKVSQANAELEKYRVIDQIVNTTFRNAIPFQWQDDNNKKRFIFHGGADSLILAYMHRSSNIKEGGIRFLKLELRDGKLWAIYRQSPFFSEDEPNPGDDNYKSEVIAENVEEISFLYAWYEEDNLTWSQEWTDPDMKYIPSAIQIKITWKDGQSECWLRRTAGMGKYKSLGNRKY